MSIRPRHISAAQLADLVEGRLPREEREDVLAHVSGCIRCRGRVAKLERTIDLMRTDASEDAPPQVIARVVRLLRSSVAPVSPGRRRVLAALRFDSMAMPPAFGVRAGQTGTRQLLFSAGDHDLDLRVSAVGETWAISGQVLGPCAGGQAELRGATAAVHTALNQMCEFTLPPVPAGGYTLTLRLPDVELEVPELQLGG